MIILSKTEKDTVKIFLSKIILLCTKDANCFSKKSWHFGVFQSISLRVEPIHLLE
jgi:hypothetical protein